MRVKRFWEKPSFSVAQDLLDRGCLWNTFVMVGRATAFLDLIRRRVIHDQELAPVLAFQPHANLSEIYPTLAPLDFSKIVLSSADPAKLNVLSIGDVGWSDLGEPRRVISVLSEAGVKNEWSMSWRQSAAATASAGASAA